MTFPFLQDEILKFDPEILIERAWMPPSSWYTEPAFYTLEKTAVLGQTWQPVARVAQLQQPGSYVAGCFVGWPWVVVRQHDGSIRAFHNVCRHKGREVVTGLGQSDALVCGYHAWSYDLDGRLKKAPKMAGVEDFNREEMSLSPLAVEVWGPWVWINFGAEPVTLLSRVSELDHMLERSAWDTLHYVASTEWTIDCNWKVYVDNYLDGGYHIPHMHPTLNDQLNMESYRTEVFGEFSVQTSGATQEETSDRLEMDAQERIGDGAIYAWIYPNVMLNRYGPCLDSNYVIPLGHDRCKVLYEFYFLETEGEEAKRFIKESIEQSAVTQKEDIEICESVQIGLQSPAYDRGRYAPRLEIGEHHFHRLLAASFRGT